MKKIVLKILNQLTELIHGWENAEAVIYGESATIGTLDPYFSIDMDVYYNGSLPSSIERCKILKDPAGFETSPVYNFDWFMIENLPATINYKNIDDIEKLIERMEKLLWVYHYESNNILYRLQKGKVLFTKNNWLSNIQSRLNNIKQEFWDKLKEDSRFVIDESLNEIGAAVYRNDNLFYRISTSHFLQSFCTFIFALNRQFEPGLRNLYDHINSLKVLPVGFKGRFESFIRPHKELSPKRKFEIAQLMTKSISKL